MRRAEAMRVTVGGVVAAALVLVVVAVCVRLGFWQLDRLEQRRAENAALTTALEQPFLELDASTAARLASEPEAFRFRPVRVRGVFRIGGDVILRGRSLGGRPGVHLLTPLALEGTDLTVLVNRGWVPAADAASIDPRPLHRSGLQEFEALVQPFPAAAGEGMPAPIAVDGHEVLSLRRLDLAELRAHSTAPLLPFYLQQLPGSEPADPPVQLSPAALDEGPHLGYALQWFSFAGIFLIGFAVIVARRAGGNREV